MLGPEDHSCILTTAEFRTLLRVSQHPHVFLQSCWKHLQEILIDFLKFLQRKILQTEGSGLNYATDIIFLHIECKDFNEFQNFGIERMVVNLEVSRADINSSVLFVRFHREEFLEDKVSIFEVWITGLKLQFEEHVIIFVVGQAEAIAFQHLSIRHSAIA